MQNERDKMDHSEETPARRLTTRNRRFTLLLIIGSLLISLALVSPYFLSEDERDNNPRRLGMISTHDMPNHLAVMESFDKMLKEGIIYPRWLPDINNGYGNATMNFYPPGFYYITSLFNLVFGDWTVTIFAISVLGLAGSGLAMYFLCIQFYGRIASAVAAVFYMLLPYHLLELYWRGAMPEYVGFILIPMIIYFSNRTGTEGRARDYAGLGLLYGLHLLIHFPVSYLLTYTLALYTLIWAVREKDPKIAVRIAAGMVLGLMMAAIYWLPAAVEGKYTQEFISEIFPYEESLISTRHGMHPFDILIHYTFITQTTALLAAVLILALTRKTRHPRQDFLWGLMGVFSTFMMTILATPVTRIIPKIQATVPAWRWLAIASVFTALSVAAVTDRLTGEASISKALLWACRIALLIVIASNVWLAIDRAIIDSLANGTLKPYDQFYQAGFTPKGSVVPENLPDSERAVLRPPVGSARVIRWDALYREVEVDIDQPGVLRLKSYYFPGWSARINGQEANLVSDTSGIQMLPLTPGQHRVEVFFENTPPRTLGSALTIAALLIMLLLSISEVRSQKSEARSPKDGRG
ncbi:MAG TPA: 6-pyruvoyl-tetrahydropterin synthase-related protein [Blastocatellia bacterium]|nr:6-pyruvoyl-tetrahydropterin synthase-related protein [Blastocatellia bacterium]